MVRRYPIDSKGKLEVPTGSLLTVVVGWVTHWYPTDSRGRLEVHIGTLTVEVRGTIWYPTHRWGMLKVSSSILLTIELG